IFRPRLLTVSQFGPLIPPEPRVCFRNERLLPSPASRNVNICPVLSTLRILPGATAVHPNPCRYSCRAVTSVPVRPAGGFLPAPTGSGWQTPCSQQFAASLSLFALFFALRSFVFNSLQTLLRKHPGWHTLTIRLRERPPTISRRSVGAAVSIFRINTSKSVSKQTALTSFRINTYEKPRGRGDPATSTVRAKSKRARRGVPSSQSRSAPRRLRVGAFGEAAYCFGFRVVDVENGEELGDLQNFLELAAQVAELEPGALGLGAVMRGHQRPEPGAVNEGHVVHVQHDFLFAGGNQAFHFFAKRVALFSQHDAPIQRHHCHAIHFPVRHLECHVVLSSSIAVPAATVPGPQSISVIVRARHVIAAHRANQFAAPRLQPLGADGTILRSIFLRGALFRVRVELRRCAPRRLRRNRRRPWLHGMFHGGDGYSTSPSKGKAPAAQVLARARRGASSSVRRPSGRLRGNHCCVGRIFTSKRNKGLWGMGRGSAMRRLSITVMMGLAIPAFAAAQHRGGAIMSAPATSARGGTVIYRGGGAPMRGSVRVQSGTESGGRAGAPVGRTRITGRPIRRGNSSAFGSNGNGFNDVPGLGFGFGSGATNFQNAPGLGFDFPHQAAVSGNRRMRGDRFGRGGFGFGDFILGGPGYYDPGFYDEGQPADTQPADAQSSAADDNAAADEYAAADAYAAQQRARRRARASIAPSEPETQSAPAPQPDVEQYVFVRRDGGLVFAVAYAWVNGTLRYVTPEGLSRTIGRDALDLNATQQFNEQRGLNFRVPA